MKIYLLLLFVLLSCTPPYPYEQTIIENKEEYSCEISIRDTHKQTVRTLSGDCSKLRASYGWFTSQTTIGIGRKEK